MTALGSRPAYGERLEGVVQVAIMLVIGTAAGAASFTHVHDVAAGHGQPGWLAWADAVTLELMSIASGLEIRRRHRMGRPVWFASTVLVCAVALSLAAQVVEAEPSVIGWLAAALPALGFLAMVKLALARTVAVAESAESIAVQDEPETKVEAMRRAFAAAVEEGRTPDHRELALAAGADISHARRVHRRLAAAQSG
ncbi:hypothetical protein Prum_058620 [Phytohabitans rumicis]|uniref:DUF2637 domain-containing protein n=1 Tax=Phytohabitans rumicis TaxID=1076125 RepID=A0A6V8L9D2_9ACTN|nr:DUF2637 domain-containing protein [Phytohabitans rumicis]GFJ92220.1 hypothetical protein Prum_058620 [Phytohabitans rumicis]